MTTPSRSSFRLSAGWTGFLAWDPESEQARSIHVDDSDYLRLLSGDHDYFAVVHHAHGSYAVSGRHLSDVGQELSRVTVSEGKASLQGDQGVWQHLPQFYGGWDANGPDAGRYPYSVVRVDRVSQFCDVRRMEWLTGPEYDLGYQAMLAPLGLPGGLTVLIPIQRSSRPVIYDWDAGEVVGHIELRGHLGNPTLRFRNPTELWADDYDTLVCLEPQNWETLRQRQLQGAAGETGGFIGKWCFTPDRSLCAVGRPFGGDVLGIDCETFEITDRAALGGQPLDVAVLSDRRVFARDWKSGEPIVGALEPV